MEAADNNRSDPSHPSTQTVSTAIDICETLNSNTTASTRRHRPAASRLHQPNRFQPQPSTKDWSRPVRNTDESTVMSLTSQHKPRNAMSSITALASPIGLGRATGLSRAPDRSLARSPQRMQRLLADLSATLHALERDGLALIDHDADTSASALLDKWDSLLAGFRRLTMAITASNANDIQLLAMHSYEAAADAALLGGNLSFYLACQTNLLRDLYNTNRPQDVTRRPEFIAYSLLYFGTFCNDYREVATTLRDMPIQLFHTSSIQFALSIIKAYNNQDGPQYIALYQQADTRQRTILSMALPAMRKAALNSVVRAYMTLDKKRAMLLTGSTSETDFFNLLQTQKPDLAKYNEADNAEFHFRLPSRK